LSASPQAQFGISISCYRGDLFLLKGCLNSIRQFIPDIPISLIKHGSFDTDRLCEFYDATAVEQYEVNPRLAAHSYGYGLTKMVAFWHSPFERFLHIDPDAVCWGDILEDLPWRDHDFIYNEPHEEITPYIQRTQYFDPVLVSPHYPDIPWKGQPFFNTGIFSARRGILDLDEYLDLLEFQRRVPGSFFTDQGPLNAMVFRQVAQGRLDARPWPLQAVVPVITVEQLEQRFRFARGNPVVRHDDRRLIHWAGVKPMVSRPTAFDAPMTHYRLRHLSKVRPFGLIAGRLTLALEEFHTRVRARYGGNYFRAGISKARHFIRRAQRRSGLGEPA
jgi:hypothetical protein